MTEMIARRGAGVTEPPLSFAQEQLWFIDEFHHGLPAHNVPHQIGLVGGSAGGHLVLLAAYSDNDDQTLQGTGGNFMVDARVQAVVDLYGPVELKASKSGSKSILKFMGGKTI